MWLLFLKYLNDLERDKSTEDAVEGKKYSHETRSTSLMRRLTHVTVAGPFPVTYVGTLKVNAHH